MIGPRRRKNEQISVDCVLETSGAINVAYIKVSLIVIYSERFTVRDQLLVRFYKGEKLSFEM